MNTENTLFKGNTTFKTPDDDYFYSLIRPQTARKLRRCLKCNLSFQSRDIGNRICSQCSRRNDIFSCKIAS